MSRTPLRLSGRLVICIGLVWFLPGLALAAVGIGLSGTRFDPGRVFWVLLTTLMMAAALWLWHGFVSWTLGRVIGTATFSALVLAQAIAWMPLWNAGCVTVDVLRSGQSSGLAGVWIMAMTYAWWGIGAGAGMWRKRIMSASARRIMYGLGLIPFITGVWLVLTISLEEFVFDTSDGEWRAVMVAHAVGATLFAGVWILAWRREAFRSARSLLWTGCGAIAYIVLSTVAGRLMNQPDDGPRWYFIFWIAGPLMLTGLWFAATALFWSRGTATAVIGPIDMNAALRCRACDYSLVGLTEARCPECGRKQTLDELFSEVLAMQPDV